MRSPLPRSGLTALAAAGLAVVVTACSTAPPPRLYVLSALATPPTGAAVTASNARPLSIGVQLTTVPEYLDRPEIVTRSGPNELQLADSDRWAERLPTNITRVLAEDLAILLPSANVTALPARGGQNFDVEVAFDLAAFDFVANGGGNCTVAGKWTIRDANSRTEIASSRVSLQETLPRQGYDAVAATMSRSLATISAQIAEIIASRPATRRAS
jgi:uncharacterized lipoprotein YmbA